MARADRQAWDRLQRRIVRCRRCPRLIEHCRSVAETKRAAYRNWRYWGKPVPDFGDPDGRLLIVGLAPAAHGANRTGRMFTGDRSGDFLYRALYETGLANQPTCTDRHDGLELRGVAITAAVHCAPPANKPTRAERDECFGWFERTVSLMPNLRGMIALGGIGFDACVELHRKTGWAKLKPKPKFAHGKFVTFDDAPFIAGCYHPSQQNTFTGRLTQPMMQRVFRDAIRLADQHEHEGREDTKDTRGGLNDPNSQQSRGIGIDLPIESRDRPRNLAAITDRGFITRE